MIIDRGGVLPRFAVLVAVAATVGVSIVGVVAGRGAPAGAGDPGPVASAESDAVWQRELVLADLERWIQARPGIGTSGFLKTTTEPQAGSVVVDWHGPADQVQRQILDEARRRDIPLTVRLRKYTPADIERASARIEAIGAGTGLFENFKPEAFGDFGSEFDGITLQGEHIRPPAEGVPAADAALAQALSAAVGVAVTIVHGQIQLL
ncbi:hypothetical protein KOI35_18795 [Actinoplanes bogorensis]|uniref:Uncharacterized protein n=1 Tax=Paractinoplanes bogorensis TaxID=1610840 RepID=A0ABS5YQ38_9ACTN|nr:hypothetical protein [Actinoplanes bogorensis]MBU2665561.1 hypothetical protein [Actinoplanes bogorensis]